MLNFYIELHVYGNLSLVIIHFLRKSEEVNKKKKEKKLSFTIIIVLHIADYAEK